MAVRLKGKAWTRRCWDVWVRDEGLCVLKINGEPHAGCTYKGTSPPHHIIKKSQGGSDDPENLATLCINGHLAAHGEGNFPESQEEIKEALLEYTSGFAEGTDEGMS